MNLDILFPRTCQVCGARLRSTQMHLCHHCLRDLPLTFFWDNTYNIMADRLNEKLQSDTYEPYARCAALFFYAQSNNYKYIPQSLKYDAHLTLGRYFARMLGERLASSADFCDVDLVVPVPLHWTRRLKRGYNQSDVLASEIARALRAAHAPHLLTRTRRTHSQAMTNIEQKAANVGGAFAPNKKLLTQSGGVKIRNVIIRPQHILLIDDTFTTGSTCAECHRALRSAFPTPTRISVATLACVGE